MCFSENYVSNFSLSLYMCPFVIYIYICMIRTCMSGPPFVLHTYMYVCSYICVNIDVHVIISIYVYNVNINVNVVVNTYV